MRRTYLPGYLVSMIDGDLFDKLAQIARIIRRSTEPFGGIQVDWQDQLFWLFEGITYSAI